MLMKYFLALLLLLCTTASAADEQFSFSPAPGWVEPVEIPSVNETPHAEVRDGAHYLHFGRQVRVPAEVDPSYYYRYVIQITNQTGLDDQSQINVSFDPVYERVEFHHLKIIRDGQTINRLASAQLRLLDQEDELDQQLYNGTRTANLLLEDLRVGDVLDYSYTIHGNNPVFAGVFNANFKLQWAVPVSSLNMRLLWQKPGEPISKLHNSSWPIRHRRDASGHEYLIQAEDVPPLLLEDDVPDWFNPYAEVQFSEQAEWREVVDWGRGLFQKSTASSAEIREIARGIEQKAGNRAEQVAATLQFVQDNIRYVGIELGTNSHQASPAPEVLARRYGDCKDKTSLMITLLREQQIDAYPALVNTYREHRLAQSLPSMRSFNHVLVALPLEDKTYWLDPTRSHQIGELEQIYQPDYGLALVLKPDEAGLTGMQSGGPVSGYEVFENYDLTDADSDVATMSVVTEYFGANAEWQISKFERDSIAEIGQSYLEYYQGYYPDIVALGDPQYEVDRNDHRFKVKESYRIDGFWKRQEGDDRDSGWIYSSSINSYLDKPDKITREQVYELGRKLEIKQNIKISLEKGKWDLSDNRFDEDNEIFHYRVDEKFDASSNTMNLAYVYTRKAEYVDADGYPAYLAALERADEQTDFGLYRNQEEAVAVDEADTESIAIALGLVLYFSSIAASIFLWRLDVKRRPYEGEMNYYPVDGLKFAFLWIGTFGLFPIYWFYRLWQFEKPRRTESQVLPKWRGFFYYFWFYSICQAVANYVREAKLSPQAPGKMVFAALALLLLIVNFAPIGFEQYWLPALLVSPFIAFPLLWMVNLANRDNPAAQRHNSRWAPRHLLLLVICLPIYFYSVGSSFGYLPADGVISGDRLLSRDVKFLQRAGIIEPGDRVAYFYSDALWSLRDDGNGFSQRHVFSYWKDDRDRLRVELVEFEDIGDIKVHWSEGLHENTVVEVFRQNQTKVVLYLSRFEQQDRSFVDELKSRWDGSR